MKKLLFHTGFMLAMAFIFVVSVNAQISTQYRVHIPFDFQAGNVRYSAGEYVVGPLNSAAGRSTLAILDVENRNTKFLGQATLVGDGRKSNGKIVFVKTDNGYVLSEIDTSTFGFKTHVSSADARIGETARRMPETVAVKLK